MTSPHNPDQAATAWQSRLSDLQLIAGMARRTELIPVTEGVPGGHRIWLKLETQQPVRSFKIRGAGTLLPEIIGQLEEREAPMPQSVHAPIGGGGLISGLADANRDAGTPLAVVGHEVSGADSAARSFRTEHPMEVPGELNTYAEGLAVRTMGERPHQRIREGLIDRVSVSSMAAVGEAYLWYRRHVLPTLGVTDSRNLDAPPAGDGSPDFSEDVWQMLPEVSSMVAVAGLLDDLRTAEGSATGPQDHVLVITGANTNRRAVTAALEAIGA